MLFALGCRDAPRPSSDPPTRIITLTPSVTEIVLALDARDRLIAVDRFSRESPDVKKLADVTDLPQAGDFVAPNIEVIAKLKPDLVILDAAQAKQEASLASAGYRTLSIQMHSMKDVRAAVGTIAAALSLESRGAKLLSSIDAAIAAAARQYEKMPVRPRVLWVIDRRPGDIANIIAAGADSYADELIRMVGGQNVLRTKGYPKISAETLARLEVDLIIDSSGAAQESMAEWPRRPGQTIAPLPTSAATPRPDVTDSLGRVGNLVINAAALMAKEAP